MKPGDRIQNYRLIRLVSGGDGVEIWEAEHELLNERMALKALTGEFGQAPEERQALKEELLRGRELAHPNIVRVHEFIEDGDLAAISMEFFESKSLAERLLPKAVNVEALTPIATQICSALHHVHQTGMVHGDIRPDTILLGDCGSVKLAEFGVAHSVEATTVKLGETRLADSGVGACWSPQVRHGALRTEADDIYALGATLRRLLCGAAAEDDEEESTTSVNETRERRNLPRIAQEWDAALAACLEEDPGNRPTTVLELAERLELAVAPTVMEPARESLGVGLSRRGALLLAGSLGGIVLLAGAYGWADDTRRNRSFRPRWSDKARRSGCRLRGWSRPFRPSPSLPRSFLRKAPSPTRWECLSSRWETCWSVGTRPACAILRPLWKRQTRKPESAPALARTVGLVAGPLGAKHRLSGRRIIRSPAWTGSTPGRSAPG